MTSSVRRRNAAVSALMGTATIVFALPAMAQTQSAPPPSAAGVATAVEGVIVTATKRPEAVRKISGSVSAFDEKTLETLGAGTFADYLTRTPGVVFNQTAPGNSTAIIRGVATTTGIAQAQGTTGYFIDDVPLTDPFYSAGIPDIDTFDVDNVVVLRGPQGTLFGSASLGGAINYQASRPNLSAFAAHLRVTGSDAARGGASYGAEAMVNLPVVKDVFAIRAVFTRRHDSGYVDNDGTGKRDSNSTTVTGGRVLATWAPTDKTTVNYLFLDQTDGTPDAGSSQPGVGRYAKSTLIPEPFEYHTLIHNLRLDQDLGFATLTATATYHSKTFTSQQDFSGLAPAFAPVDFVEFGDSKGETYEARLTSPTGRRFEYLFGLFHDSTTESVTDLLVAPSAAPLFGTATLLSAVVGIKGRESAAFGEATYHVSDALKLTLGGRLFHTELATITSESGPLAGASTVTSGGSRQTGFSPKASLTWQPTSDILVYGLVSKGFRYGGPNIATDPNFAIPRQFTSDSLINYELGARTNWLDRRLQLDGTLFWVDWSNIQVTLQSPSGFTYTANAGKARNLGFEGSATFHATPALSLQGSITYLDATLRRDFESASGLVPSGARLPGASRWQVSDSIIYNWPGMTGHPSLVFSHRYISSAPGEIAPVPQIQGGYNLFDVRLSATFDNVEVTGFIENIGDARGVTEAVTSVRGPVQFLARPRTFGITLDYRL